MAEVGVQSELDVNSVSTLRNYTPSSPSTWAWVWFGLAVVVIIGFHIRVFGHPIPPAAQFP